MASKEGVSTIKGGHIKRPTNKMKRVAFLSGASKKQKLTDSASIEPVKVCSVGS